MDTRIYEVAGGELALWQDESGTIFLKVQQRYNDPVELAEHEAQELAELLVALVKKARE